MPGIATAPELERVIADLVSRLEGGIRVDAVVLFGSYVRGTADEWSDIDIAVISPDFEGLRMTERVERLADLLSGADSRIMALGHTPAEYRDPRGTFLAEIMRTGKIVYEAPHAA